jgi:hypothetical protein
LRGGFQQSAINKIRAALDVRDEVVSGRHTQQGWRALRWNALHVGPIFNDDGEVGVFHYGSQWDITDLLVEREPGCGRSNDRRTAAPDG